MALVSLLAVSACATTAPDTQAKIDSGSQIACVGMEAADGLFNLCATSPDFPKHDFCAAHAVDEAKVYAGIKVACTPPYTLDAKTLIAKAVQAAKDIKALAGQPPGS